jgi:hypothetical protein
MFNLTQKVTLTAISAFLVVGGYYAMVGMFHAIKLAYELFQMGV